MEPDNPVSCCPPPPSPFGPSPLRPIPPELHEKVLYSFLTHTLVVEVSGVGWTPWNRGAGDVCFNSRSQRKIYTVGLLLSVGLSRWTSNDGSFPEPYLSFTRRSSRPAHRDSPVSLLPLPSCLFSLHYFPIVSGREGRSPVLLGWSEVGRHTRRSTVPHLRLSPQGWKPATYHMCPCPTTGGTVSRNRAFR